jgi:hypothetical protein
MDTDRREDRYHGRHFDALGAIMSGGPVNHRQRLTEALRAAFPTAKHLALAGGVSIPTAERYRLGRTFPDVFTLARLMGSSCAIAEAFLRLAGLDDLSLDQEQARLVRALAELEAKRTARHADLAAAYAVAGIAPPAWVGAQSAASGAAGAPLRAAVGGAAAPKRAR